MDPVNKILKCMCIHVQYIMQLGKDLFVDLLLIFFKNRLPLCKCDISLHITIIGITLLSVRLFLCTLHVCAEEMRTKSPRGLCLPNTSTGLNVRSSTAWDSVINIS